MKDNLAILFLLTIIGLCVTLVVRQMNDEVEYRPGLYTEVTLK